MHDEDGYLGERVAARYDESSAEMSDPAVVEPVVELLAELAGSGRERELGATRGLSGALGYSYCRRPPGV